ncbi:hypothetical protein AcW1_009603 [Taiwanofungus camphoratus]|nr:hypothetical protein AcV5_002495 [Antrodia cinnamomea]KAI0942076.1 hypothetical protein AcV7_002605 [Antrodia cinnamomea]KAI0947979.1 hypothetical protein AcW1_009603 [Antrodia cinnamomea]
MSQQQISVRHPASVIFLLHIALDVPLAVQGLWSPMNLPFLQLTNTTLVLIKMYAALLAGTCITSLLCYGLPEFLPGKRAFAIALCFYHVTCSTILFNAPRFIPYSFGPFFESSVCWSPMFVHLFLIKFLQLASNTRGCMGNSPWPCGSRPSDMVASDCPHCSISS